MLRRYREPIGHWNTFFHSFSTSPLDFYRDVESAVAKRRLPDVSVSRVEYKQGGLLSNRREYLRVRRERLVFDICAAPYGNGFFFSWWFVEDPPPWKKALLVLLGLMAALGWGLKKALVYLAPWAGGMGRQLLVELLLLALTLVLAFWTLRRAVSEESILGIPILGRVYEIIVKPVTYYRIDTQEMFQAAIHGSVLEAVDGLQAAVGARALAPKERLPFPIRVAG